MRALSPETVTVPAPRERKTPVFSVAPMMDWTDSLCRQFHRRPTRRALLYTEMVAAAALVRGPAWHLLSYEPEEQPLALQLGGSNPKELAAATKIAASAGYTEVNLNVGCPSDRVQEGCFGALLMRTPEQVGEICAAMRQAAPEVEITVKCRLGVDEQDPNKALPALLDAVRAAGVRRVIVHARKAWLAGLSPKENREIPPLDYDLPLAIKQEFPELAIHLNGGLASLDEAAHQLARGYDGVMIGRAAYHRPLQILGPIDRVFFGEETPAPDPIAVAHAMRPVIARHLARGGKLSAITRHMLGLFADRPGARAWRQALTRISKGTLDDYDALLSALTQRLAA